MKGNLLEPLIRKIYKYITSRLENVYIYKSADIINEYNRTNHSTIKMKPADEVKHIY